MKVLLELQEKEAVLHHMKLNSSIFNFKIHILKHYLLLKETLTYMNNLVKGKGKED